MIIGITGLIGSGKTIAAKIFKSFGAAIIDADKIGRQVVESNKSVLQKLVKKFGCGILSESGKLNRKKLASIAFKNENSKRKLNRIVHPYLLKELKKQVKKFSGKFDIVVIDAALLLDWDLGNLVDLVILIHASEKNRFNRLKRRGITKDDARTRQKRQLSYRQYRSRSDYVVFNNQTPEKLMIKLEKIIRKVTGK